MTNEIEVEPAWGIDSDNQTNENEKLVSSAK